jgi:hypothetical protein
MAMTELDCPPMGPKRSKPGKAKKLPGGKPQPKRSQ